MIDLVHDGAAERWGGWHWRDPFTRDGEHYRTCSFCGSINPEDLLAEGVIIPQWADMKYGWPHKFYVDINNRDPERLFVVGTTNAPTPHGEGWVAASELTDEQCDIITQRHHSVDNVTFFLFGTRAIHSSKFYTIHLKDVTLSQTVVDGIEKACGLHFTFTNDNIAWEPVSRD